MSLRAPLLSLLLLLLTTSPSSSLSPSSAASLLRAAGIPDPSVTSCGWSPSHSRLCDPHLLLSSAAAAGAVQATLEAIELGPSAACGAPYQVAVLALQHLPAPLSALGATPELATAAAARAAHDGWGVGSTDCQSGVVLLLTLAERQVFISTGAAVKAVLTDASAGAVIRRMRPLLRRPDYDAALLLAAEDIRTILGGGPLPPALAASIAAESQRWLSDEAWEGACQMAGLAALLGALLGALVVQERSARRQQRDWATVRAHLLAIERARGEAAAESAAGGGAQGAGEEGARGEVGGAPAPGLRHRAQRSDEEEDPAAAAADAGSPLPPPGADEPRALLPAAASLPLAARLSCCPVCLEPLDEAPGAVGVIVLACRHRFHLECCDEWMGRARTCPVCRATAHDGGADEGGGAGTSGGAPARAASQQGGLQHAADLLFLQGSLRRRYPRIVTANMFRAWRMDGAAMAHDAPLFAAAEPARVAAAAAAAAARRSHSGGGFGGRSFGGGGSRGGGGRGGTW